jgi:lipopolysaccharide biosynthesis glycosyltransferase
MTSTERRAVVVATDENFAMPTAVTLRSLLLNGGANVAITVLHNGLSIDAIDGIVGALPTGDRTLSWHDVSDFVPGATTASHLPDSTYFRLQLAEALGPSVERALYLDVDMLIRKDLSSLWDLDMQGSAIAAVQSVNYPYAGTRGAVDDWQELGLDPRAPFFNAGLLLVDLAKWREHEVSERALAYLRSPHCGKGADQEALNVATSGGWLRLPPTWNQQTPMLDNQHGAHLFFSGAEVDTARTDPAIVHFQTRPKPWHRGCTHPWRQEWLDVATDTPFTTVTDLRERTLADELRWRTRRAASALVKGR